MIKIFNYLPELDCFIVDPVYKKISDHLGLTEWNEVVWIGRFFLMDNDFGEHWFDNWDQREKLEDAALKLGIETDNLLIIDSCRFKTDVDGPIHTDEERTLFWKDVLISLSLSFDTIAREAKKINYERVANGDEEDFIADLEDRIKLLRSTH